LQWHGKPTHINYASFLPDEVIINWLAGRRPSSGTHGWRRWALTRVSKGLPTQPKGLYDTTTAENKVLYIRQQGQRNFPSYLHQLVNIR
jgi:hypothetical protein